MNYFSSKKNSIDKLAPLKALILLHIGLCVFSALFEPLFPYWKLPSLHSLLSLSLWGLDHHCFWQFLTHFLTAPLLGVNLSLVFYLLFSMYFLWNIGSSIIERKGVKDFLILYLGGGVFSGLIISLFLYYTNSLAIISGINPALYALLTAWMILVPDIQILLFFTIPVKIKWLILGVLGANLFIDFSNGNFVNFFLYLSSISFGYFYSLFTWQIHSPFTFLHSFEKILINLSIFIKKNLKKKKMLTPIYYSQKIYDFKTGEAIVKEEDFLNNCLSKIAIHGEKSLTFLERWKMKKISKKMKRKTAD